jgi:hypothetical protein
MSKQTQNEEQQGRSTSDVNLATFIKVVKEIDSCGHYFEGKQLFLKFPITKEQMSQYKEEYINSIFSIYDATKRNYLRLLK